MAKFSYIHSLALLSCVAIYAADEGVAGKKRTRSDSNGSVAAASVRECPATPTNQIRSAIVPRSIKVWSAGRGVYASALPGVPEEVKNKLPDQLENSQNIAEILFEVKDAARYYSTPTREAIACAVQGIKDAAIVQKASVGSGAQLSPASSRRVVVQENYLAGSVRKHQNIGVSQGMVRPVNLLDLTDNMFALGYRVTPAVDLGHMSEAPVIKNNGTLNGGHAYQDYIKPPFTIMQKVNLLGHACAAAIKISYDVPKKGLCESVKTVWCGDGASKEAIADRVLNAQIVGVDKSGYKHLLACPDGLSIGFLKDYAAYGVVFPSRFITQQELQGFEIVLGTDDSGVAVTISADDVKTSLKQQCLKHEKTVTVFKDYRGKFVLSGVCLSGLPSGASVELTPELEEDLAFFLPTIPQMDSPVKTGTPIRFKGSALAFGISSAASLRRLDFSGAGGAGDSSMSGHELK